MGEDENIKGQQSPTVGKVKNVLDTIPAQANSVDPMLPSLTHCIIIKEVITHVSQQRTTWTNATMTSEKQS